MPPSLGSGQGRTRIALGALFVGLPWLWFVVRGLGSNMDVVAVLLPLIGLTALLTMTIISAFRRSWLFLLVGLSVFGVAVVATVGPRLPQGSGAPKPPITLAMANVYGGNPTPAAAAAAMDERRVDVAVAVEMPPGFWGSLRAQATLPYGFAVGQFGIESRWPLRRLPHGLAHSRRLLRIGVEDPSTPFVLYVVHEPNPLHDSFRFGDQSAFARQVLALARTERLPVVAVGDFNTSDRTLGYRLFTGAMKDAMRANEVSWSTFDGGWWATLFLRIDHAFIPRDWCAENGSTFAVPGSDHHGIQVTMGPCA